MYPSLLASIVVEIQRSRKGVGLRGSPANSLLQAPTEHEDEAVKSGAEACKGNVGAVIIDYIVTGEGGVARIPLAYWYCPACKLK